MELLQLKFCNTPNTPLEPLKVVLNVHLEINSAIWKLKVLQSHFGHAFTCNFFSLIFLKYRLTMFILEATSQVNTQAAKLLGLGKTCKMI